MSGRATQPVSDVFGPQEDLGTAEKLPESDRVLGKAIIKLQQLFQNDGQLVLPGALQHDIRIVVGEVSSPLTEHAYNFRLPLLVDIAKLKTTRRVIVACEDYRQSAEVAGSLEFNPEKDIFISMAGGPAQPGNGKDNTKAYFGQQRGKALAVLLCEVGKVNPDVVFEFVVHTGRCGGANYLTDDEIVRSGQEEQILVEFSKQLGEKLREKGPTNTINHRVARIVDDMTTELVLSN